MPRPKPTNPPSDYVTRAQLVRALKPPTQSFRFRGFVFVLPACSYLLRPVSTWVSLVQLTLQRRKLTDKDFSDSQRFTVIPFAVHLVRI